MVDSINPASQLQNVLKTESKAQKSNEAPKAEEAKSSSAVDEVRISEEALNLKQAEESTQQIAQYLAQDNAATLSNDQDRLNTLV